MSAKIDLKFLDIDKDSDYLQTECNYCPDTNDKYISVSGEESGVCFCISLDIPTAIKFAKTIRTEINKAKEVQNG